MQGDDSDDSEARSREETELVSVLLVTYNPDPHSLAQCLTSIREQTYGALEIILVDNGSSRRARDSLFQEVRSAIGEAHPTKIQFLGTNTGFAHAVNVAVAAAIGNLCLLLNPDTVLQPEAVASLVGSAGAHPEVVGFAPKIKLIAYPDVIDSVGIEFSSSGDAAQRGLGQVDLGQFEAPERVMGLTMCAALIRRKAFGHDQVGPLDERFFMFFEDVDWSMRASLYGMQFLTVARAVVFHAGSESVRKKSFAWRYHLIERNVYYTAIKNLETRHLARFLVIRTLNHIRMMASGVRVVPTLRILAGATAALAWMLPDRRKVQSRRRRRDREVMTAATATSAVDLERWQPLYGWSAVRDSVGRLYAVTGEEKWSAAHRYLDTMLEFQLQLEPAEVLRRLDGLAGPLPAALLRYGSQIVAKVD